jgi:hypothetical protein
MGRGMGSGNMEGWVKRRMKEKLIIMIIIRKSDIK